MNRFKRSIPAWILIAAILFPFAGFAAKGAPKLLNLFLDYEMTDEDAARLAKWDVVVLDMDQQFAHPDLIRRMRAQNSGIKILAYVSASEIADARFNEHPAAPGSVLAHAISESWFLHRADGSRASWWPGTSLMNATDLGPTVNNQRWNTFLGPFIRDRLMSTGLWDGVFLDGAYGDVTGRFGTDLDLDADGLANPAKQNDESWRAGMAALIQNVRAALGPDKIVMNNSSVEYAAYVNGVLFENFPRGGWAWPFSEFRMALASGVRPNVSAVNTNTDNQNRPDAYRLMRYGLASALVAGGYFSFDQGDSGHNRTWWYDEYEATLGDPLRAARVIRGPSRGAYPALWSREYDQALVLVNALPKAQALLLPGEFEKLRGAQDPIANDGSIVDRVIVPSEDGTILLKRADARSIRNVMFTNGVFYEIYGADGTKLRNGFFASRDDVPGGANVLVADLDRDRADDLAYAVGGQITIRMHSGKRSTLVPFGAHCRCAIALALDRRGKLSYQKKTGKVYAKTISADIDGDGTLEMLVPRNPF